jgi:hypothetical protein
VVPTVSIEINLFFPVNANTSWLIMLVPPNQRSSIFLSLMNEKLLAASSLLFQSGALLVSDNIKLAAPQRE